MISSILQFFSVTSALKLILCIFVFYQAYLYGKYDAEYTNNRRRKCEDTELRVPFSSDYNSLSTQAHTKCIVNRTKIYDHCSSSSGDSRPNFVYKHDISLNQSIIDLAFYHIHHPPSPVIGETIISQQYDIGEGTNGNPYSNCKEVYMTRTGSLARMPNKCVAIARVPEGASSPWKNGHRVGTQANLTNQYQDDYSDRYSQNDEKNMLPLMLKALPNLIKQLKDKLGEPLLPNGERRTATVMIANEGVLDLLLNFICSTQSSAMPRPIDISTLLVFVGEEEYAKAIESLGAKAFYSEALGAIPKQAASNYGDRIFGKMMWLKATSVYLVSAAGFDVIFQDADLVWLRDPVPHFKEQFLTKSFSNSDFLFMDDGARTPRFTPFFVNTGFYYQRYTSRTIYLMEKMLKSVDTLFRTNSHQAVLIRHITEAHHLYNLDVGVLDQDLFPSGIMFHHNKTYIESMLKHEVHPFVFHMCWTASREDKVKYFKEMGFWFLSQSEDSSAVCSSSQNMLNYLNSSSTSTNKDSLQKKCCYPGDYWKKLQK